MSLIDKIEKIREKPESFKNLASLGMALFGTVFIILVWFSVSPSEEEKDNQITEIEKISKEVSGPFASAKEMFQTAYADIKDMTALILRK